ncbi:MAG TPA: murein biosynthesis integral membrane protein MurJ, partial [Aliiroseovarius sp.]|nr:murein biosynthesis integral membrane protein MurJ [Aliiroseovarius sp.]
FMAAAAAPVLLNVLFISAVAFSGWMGWDVGLTLVWTVPIAGIAQMALVWVAAARAGFRLVPRRPRMTPELKRLAVIAAPAALAGGVVQVNLLIGRQVASFFDGAIAWLSYADRLYQLPLGVVGIAIGVVLLPDITRRLAAGDAEGGREVLSRAGEMALALTIPSSVALIMVPMPLVQVLFERGAFTSDDSAKTAVVVAIYGLGLPAFVLQKVLQPVYFARSDTRTPFHYALVALVVNAVLAIGLAFYVGYIAAAIATSVAGWVMTLQLWRGARRMGEYTRFDRRFWSRAVRIVIASWAMGAVLLGLQIALGPMFGAGGLKYLALLIMVTVGAASYFAIGALIGAFRLSEFKAAVRRG